MVLVVVLPILIVALVVVVACIITVVVMVVMVAVLIAFSIARRPLFTVLGTVSLPAVRTTVVVLFAAAFAMFVALLIGGTVFLIRRR